jgi:hypothetical protein
MMLVKGVKNAFFYIPANLAGAMTFQECPCCLDHILVVNRPNYDSIQIYETRK